MTQKQRYSRNGEKLKIYIQQIYGGRPCQTTVNLPAALDIRKKMKRGYKQSIQPEDVVLRMFNNNNKNDYVVISMYYYIVKFYFFLDLISKTE